MNRVHRNFLLNTIGLGIGIASVILVLVFVQDERSYDRYHEQADRVYRVTTHETAVDQQNTYATTVSGLAPALVNEIPEIMAAVRLTPFGRGLPVQAGERQFYEDNYFYADSTVFDVFSFRFIYGVARQALTRPNTVVFTESAATKYFGNVDHEYRIILSKSFSLRFFAIDQPDWVFPKATPPYSCFSYQNPEPETRNFIRSIS